MIEKNIQQLAKALENYQHDSNCRSIEEQQDNLILKLLYNEIIRYSKEELEDTSVENAVKYKDKNKDRIYNALINHRHYFLFSALLKKGAFFNKLDDSLQYLLLQNPSPSPKLYEAIFFAQKNYQDLNGREFSESSSLNCVFSYLNFLPEKDAVIESMIYYYFHKDPSLCVKYFVKNTESLVKNTFAYFIKICERENYDINQNDPLNDFLKDSNQKFFIESYNLPKIVRLLENGFCFNESKYEHQGKNLFISLILSNHNAENTKVIIPHLKSVEPKKLSWADQDKIIENLSKTNNDLYEFIKPYYQKLSLELKLPANEEKTLKKKL